MTDEAPEVRGPLTIGLDPTDPTRQAWYRGGRMIARFTIEAAESMLRVANDTLARQKEHASGARIVMPPVRGL